MKPEKSAINLNKIISKNKPIVDVLPIWEVGTHKIEEIVIISNISNKLFKFVHF